MSNLKNTDKAVFFQLVYEVVQCIPRGRVTSYGAIADALGRKKAARMVGWALNKVKDYKNIPAHRVVNRKGVLTGKIHFQTIKMMQNLLESEGVEVKDDKVLYFDKLFWDPKESLKID